MSVIRMIRVRIFIKYLMVPVLCWLLSACGLQSCLTDSSKCDFGSTSDGAGLFSSLLSVPPLPSIASLQSVQYKTTTVLVKASNSGWTDTGLTLNQGDNVTVQVYPSSAYPSTGDQLIANGTVSMCYLPGSCDFSQGSLSCQLSYYVNFAGRAYLAMDPTASSQYVKNSQYPLYNSTMCSPTGFNEGSAYNCYGTGGQGIITNHNPGVVNGGSNAINGNYTDIKNQFVADPNTRNNIDPAATTFKNGAALFNIPSWQWIQEFMPSIDYTKFTPSGLSSDVLTNYKLYSVFSGCFGVNGVMDASSSYPANTGSIQYGISSDPSNISSIASLGNSNGFTSASLDSSQAGNLYFRIYEDCTACPAGAGVCAPLCQPNNPYCCYNDNLGQYEVQVITQVPYKETFLDRITSTVINAIQSQVNIMSRQFFGNIVSSAQFVNIVNICLILYIIIYGICFTLGFVMITQRDVVIRLCKIGVVLALIQEGSWTFFNTYFFQAFTGGLPFLSSIAGGGNGSVQSLFSFADQAISYLLSTGVWIRILTFIMLYPVGYYFFLMIMYSVISYMIALLEAFLVYLIALTAISFFIAMAPIFIILILFEHTRPIFENWIKLLGSFILQPVILFSCIGVINELVLNALNNILGESQYRCVVPIFLDLGIVNLDVVCFTVMIPNPAEVLTLICLSVVLLILVKLLRKLPSFVSATANFLAGGAGAGAMTQLVADIRTSAVESAKGFMGMDDASKARRVDNAVKTNRGVAAEEVDAGRVPATDQPPPPPPPATPPVTDQPPPPPAATK